MFVTFLVLKVRGPNVIILSYIFCKLGEVPFLQKILLKLKLQGVYLSYSYLQYKGISRYILTQHILPMVTWSHQRHLCSSWGRQIWRNWWRLVYPIPSAPGLGRSRIAAFCISPSSWRGLLYKRDYRLKECLYQYQVNTKYWNPLSHTNHVLICCSTVTTEGQRS